MTIFAVQKRPLNDKGLFFRLLTLKTTIKQYNMQTEVKMKIDARLILVSENVKRLLFDFPKFKMALLLELNERTLNSRLKKHTWTYKEKLFIDELIKRN